MSQEIPSRPFRPPVLPPLQARLVNALVCRALPLTVPLDAGAEQPVPCMLSFNAAAATAEQDAPFAPAAVLYLSSGEDLWRLEWSSLEALALRPDLAAWRSSLPAGEQTFARLPGELCLAVLERLLAPALQQLEPFLGCELRCAGTPQAGADWGGPLPLRLDLPGGEAVFLRLSWARENAARYVLERLEQLPMRTEAGARFMGTLAYPLEAGRMLLPADEAATLVPGDVLLPESWAPEMPRLRLPQGRALACRLGDGILSVLGPDMGDPGREPAEKGSEDGMSEEHMAPTGAVRDDGPAAEAAAVDPASVGALELPVVFEIGRLHLRLDELAALVPGHTLALGGETPSPVVDIRVAGQLLAQGRLVDVGGMPGVQITRMHAAGQDSAAPQGAGDGTGRD